MEEENTQQPPALPIQQKRIAFSVLGDTVWEISEPVLYWMLENGDEDLSHKALATLLDWQFNQDWFIEWGNQTRYFELAELACRNLGQFKQMVKIAPAENESQQRIIDFALMTGELHNKPWGIGRKNVLAQHKKQRRGRRR
jgi:hypothetical protein